jgi:D-alanyl-D-alanine dipeptidase
MPTKKPTKGSKKSSKKSSKRAAPSKAGAARPRRPASASASRGSGAAAGALGLAELLSTPPEDAYSVVFLVNPQESTEETLRVAWPETSLAGGTWFDFPGSAVESAIPLGVEESGAASLPKAAFRIKNGNDDLVRMLRSHLADRLGTELGPRAQSRGAALDITTFDEELCASDGEAPTDAGTRGATRGPEEAAAPQVALELSGPQWVARFPGSRSIFDTKEQFVGKLTKFHQALTDAGADVKISATLRPPERAYLMHFSFRIAKEGLDPRTVPPMPGVNIQWFHGNTAASRNAAAQMVAGYGIAFKPVLVSRHTQGLAVDMTITWAGVLKIKDASGTVRSIGAPRNGKDNGALHTVGSTYGVIKLVSDPPHWSNDGH